MRFRGHMAAGSGGGGAGAPPIAGPPVRLQPFLGLPGQPIAAGGSPVGLHLLMRCSMPSRGRAQVCFLGGHPVTCSPHSSIPAPGHILLTASVWHLHSPQVALGIAGSLLKHWRPAPLFRQQSLTAQRVQGECWPAAGLQGRWGGCPVTPQAATATALPGAPELCTIDPQSDVAPVMP